MKDTPDTSFMAVKLIAGVSIVLMLALLAFVWRKGRPTFKTRDFVITAVVFGVMFLVLMMR